jgi:hypothetical protein
MFAATSKKPPVDVIEKSVIQLPSYNGFWPFTLIYKGARTVEPMAVPAREIRLIIFSGFQFPASFDLFESLTVIVWSIKINFR